MSNMKDSGIEWMGEIPQKWKLNKIRYVTLLRTEKEYYRQGEKYIGLENVTSFTSKYIETESEYSEGFYDVYKEGDLLFSKLRPYLAKALLVKDSGFCTSEFSIIKKYSGDIRFLLHFLLSHGFLNVVNSSTYGTKMPRASWDFIKQLAIPFLDLKEQQAIADFLDSQCSKIDSIIEDIEKEIDILERYKKSLITETVTKGLDKNVSMKESGVEWIGEIPSHWEVTKLKYQVNTIGSGTTPDSGNLYYYEDGIYNWIQSGDLYRKDYLYNTDKQITKLALKECGALSLYEKDFVVIAMYGASIGNVVISKIDSYTNQACCALKVDKENDIRYLFYFMKFINSHLLSKAFGGTQPNISQQIIKNTIYFKISKIEQKEISDYLDSQCSKINSIIETKNKQLEIIKKHKQSLIYEYVTGKKRVKGFEGE